MRATWEELTEFQRKAILANRHRNKHAAGLYHHLVEVPAQDAYTAWIEDLTDAHADGDDVKVERLYQERYPHCEISAWDIGTTPDTVEEDDEVTIH